MSMPAARYYTAEMVRNLPDDGNRYETVHGELLVTPAPRLSHQQIVGRLFRALDAYCESTGVGETLMPPADISLTPDSLVQPDVFVHPPLAKLDPTWADIRRLLLVAEVLSPSTARADRFTKRVHYQRTGVPVYWIVDGDAREVAVWTPMATEPVIEREALTWSPPGASTPYSACS